MIDMYSRAEVFRFLGSTPTPVVDVDAASERIDRWAARIGGFTGVWAVTRLDEPATPIGTVLLVGLPTTDGVASEVYEIGWHFHPDAWGHGYATEAGGAMVSRARAAGLPEVRAVVHAANGPSRRVCERLGMSYAGQTDEWYGVTLDEYVLRL